jgi:large subunit ribosomal protein L35
MAKTKLKTRSGAKKRFQVKKSGKVKHGKAYAKHFMTFSKTPGSKRRNRGTGHLRSMDAKKVILELFPYGAN